MTFRTVAREVRDFPATACFSLIWILVFVALAVIRMRQQPAPSVWQFLVQGMGDGHRFGDLTLLELRRGEIWRVITCTFIHYSVLHIALNLLAFYLLGTLVESWYGSPRFIFIYGMTAGLGNLVSAGIRSMIGSVRQRAFGRRVGRDHGADRARCRGGLAVAYGTGQRPGLADGQGAGDHGAARHCLSAVHRQLGPRRRRDRRAALGLWHRTFLREYSSPGAWGLGVLTALVIASCGVAQVNADRREAPFGRDATLRVELYLCDVAYRELRQAPSFLEPGRDHQVPLKMLEGLAGLLDRGTTRPDYRRGANSPAPRRPEHSRKRSRPSSSSESVRLRRTFAANSRFATGSFPTSDGC